MTYVLDTNIFLRMFAKEDENDYKECLGLFNKIKSSKIDAVVAGITLTEINWVLRSYYKVSKNIATRNLETIVNSPGIKIIDLYDWTNAIKTYETTGIKLVDAVLATIPKVASHQWTIVSYDEDFKKLPILWKKPSQLP